MRLTILGVILTITSLALAASHALRQSADPFADASSGENSRGGGKRGEQTIPPFEWSPPIQTIADGSNRFAIELHRKLAAGADNLVFSPFSIHAALAMTATGAKGRTLEQMEKVLHLPDRDGLPAAGDMSRFYSTGSRPYELAVSAGLWGQKGVAWNSDFVALLGDRFAAGFNEADFAASPETERLRINAWVAERTRERIQNIIPENALSKLTRLVLANAVYFKGKWALEFDPERTKHEPFHRADGSSIDVPLMAQHSDFDYAEQEGFQLLALPYRGGDLEMVVLLPREPDGLRALENRLTAESLLDWRHAARQWDVIVHLPRFRIEHAFQANPLLASLGMTDVFDRSADLSGMIDDAAGGPRLLVSDVIHQAFIEVNEEGTEAAAATVVIAARSSPHQPPQPIEFRADRPFLFLIRDARHDTILFLGRFTGP